MIPLLRLLPLMAAAPLCSSFAPYNPSKSISSIPSRQHVHLLGATRNGDGDSDSVGRAAGSAFFAVAISFSAITAPFPGPDGDAPSFVPPAHAFPSIGTSVTIARSPKSPTMDDDDVAAIKYLERETRAVEKEAKSDARKARIEKSRENFFEYEARMAEEQEGRIEAAEKRAEIEFEKDKEQAEALKALEEKAEREAAMAQTKAEKAAKRKEAKALLAKEREAERKERRAERAERVFLAEEQQEQKILAQKESAARAEEEKFEAVEREYELEAELAKEDEVELKLAKDLLRKK